MIDGISQSEIFKTAIIYDFIVIILNIEGKYMIIQDKSLINFLINIYTLHIIIYW